MAEKLTSAERVRFFRIDDEAKSALRDFKPTVEKALPDLDGRVKPGHDDVKD
ncbi:MAG: hypothetical protein JWO51_2845 [Rhodospirillales bacterium]|nr:hypothetical protein [Rhodospirillales bacterium]